MKITLLCFSHVRDALGEERVSLELPAGATAGDAETHVRSLAPGKLAGIPLRVAVNQELVKPEAPLRDGDEVALLPPVQGG
jgi:molybdopterin converting factor subunit 1